MAFHRESESACDRSIRAVAFFMRWSVDLAGTFDDTIRNLRDLAKGIAAWFEVSITVRPSKTRCE